MLLILFSIALGQDYNPCKNKRFLSLSKMDLDDMSDREYNYFIKKEEECSKYKLKRKKKKKAIKSKRNQTVDASKPQTIQTSSMRGRRQRR